MTVKELSCLIIPQSLHLMCKNQGHWVRGLGTNSRKNYFIAQKRIVQMLKGKNNISVIFHLGFPSASVVKNLLAKQETRALSLGQEDPLKKAMASTPVFLPGEPHGQRSLTGYSPWGHKGVRLDLAKQQLLTHIVLMQLK